MTSEIQSVPAGIPSTPAARPSARDGFILLRSPRSRRKVAPSEKASPLRPDLSGISVRPAVAPADLEKVFDVRWRGHKNYFDARDDVVDAHDAAPNVTLLLATNDCDRPLGTLRILDRREGAIELDSFLDVDALLGPVEQPLVEATRFAVPRHPRSEDIKLALWKHLYDHSLARDARTLLVSARPGAALTYRRLLFQNTGPRGAFRHPRLGGRPHRTYKLFLPALAFMYRSQKHPLADFFIHGG